MVDDPFDYGAIAAANSLSDVYAMGGRPFLALNIAALPEDLPSNVAALILKGGAEKAREAGVVIAGGHTVKDSEPKYGLVALGFVDPRRMLSKGGLQIGDALVLTKPLGFGVTTTALKQEKSDPADVEEVTGWMKRLNAGASALALEFGLSAATDITGFSLLGHGLEMSKASGTALHFDFGSIPFIKGARKYAGMGTFPGGAFDNQRFYSPEVQFASSVEEADRMLLFDPQTSGGLLLGVPASKLEAFLVRARELDQPAWEIGSVQSGRGVFVR